ncbi:MAG: hypothetical protein AB7O24_34265 [Kofleriaceae bacterium]
MAKKKTPAPRRAGTLEAKEQKALNLARKAVDELANDPETLRAFIGQVAIIGRDRLV